MNIKQKNELTIAYLNTQYSVDFPDRQFWVSPVSENLFFKDKLNQEKINFWAIITPFNPGSEILTAAENKVRTEKFIKEGLHDKQTGQKKWDYHGSISKPGKDSKNPISSTPVDAEAERGFFIINIFPWEAVKLGHEFGQNAIIVGKNDGFAELVWTYHSSQISLNE